MCIMIMLFNFTSFIFVPSIENFLIYGTCCRGEWSGSRKISIYHLGGVDYDDDFMNRAMSNHDPPDLWISTPNDQFPDPKVDVEGFMVYCGESFHRLTAYLWLVTREMIEKGVELKPIAVHEPFLFSKPNLSNLIFCMCPSQ